MGFRDLARVQPLEVALRSGFLFSDHGSFDANAPVGEQPLFSGR